jgi:hypothetical protein
MIFWEKWPQKKKNNKIYQNDQIQLNQLLDDHHFGYITKLKKKKKKKEEALQPWYYGNFNTNYIIFRNFQTFPK